MKKSILFVILVLCLALSACGNDNSKPVEPTTSNPPAVEETEPSEESISEPEYLYFESDEIVDGYFAAYNSIAEIPISTEEIEKGNIKTKALVYIDDLTLEVINADDFLSVSVGSSPENEDATMFPVFRDSIKATKSSISDDEIQSAWNSIHETGYMVEDFDLNGIMITYVPTASRIDLEIPLG